MSINESQKSIVDGQFDEEIQNVFDPYKLVIVFKKSLIAMGLISIVTLLGVVIFIRYAKPIYESTSTIKLENTNRTNSLGLSSDGLIEEESSSLLGELEIIRSPIVREKVIADLNLGISYFIHGNILFDERFRNSPYVIFIVDGPTKIGFDTPIDLQILDEKTFQIEKKDFSETFAFGSLCETPFGNFIVKKTAFFEDFEKNQKTFFTFNSTKALNNYFEKNLFIDVANAEARTLYLSFKDHNALKAYSIIKSIDSIYFEQTLQQKLKTFDQSIDFLNNSIKKAEENLIEAEERFEEFMRKNKTMDVMADYTKSSELRDENALEIKNLRFKLDLLKNLESLIVANKTLDEFIPLLSNLDNEQLTSVIENLNVLNQEKDNMLLSQTENTLAYQKKKSAAIKAKQDALDLVKQNEQITQKQIHELNLEKFEIESSIVSLPAKETEMTRLKRQYNLYDKFYGLLMDKLVEQGLTKAGVTVDFIVLSPPTIENTPIYPKKSVLLLTGVGLAILLSFALVLVRLLLYDTITTLGELERAVPIPIIGSVPEYLADKMNFSQLIVDKSSKSAISESLRSIRTNIEFIAPSKGPKVITVTSTVGGEGKTFVAVNLAGVIALTNQRVVVLDLDMRKPKVHLAFGAENHLGLSTILIEKNSLDECVQHSRIPDLDFITAGPTPPNPSELILLPSLNKLIEDLKQRYDVIIIDTPPVGIVTDGILLMSKADIPLYVVRINYSKFFVSQEIKRTLNRGGYNKLRVIANAVPTNRGFKYNYGYYENESTTKPKGWFKKILEKI